MKWFITFCALWAAILSAQIPYELPSEDIVEIFDRPRPPVVNYLEKSGKLMIYDRESYMPLELLALEKFELAGIEITPQNRAHIRSSFLKNPRVMDIATGEITDLGLNGYFGGASFSPDERYAVMNQYEPDRITVWRWDSKTGAIDPIYTGECNQAFDSEFIWLPDGENFLLRTVPEGYTNPPSPPVLPVGPIVFESNGEKKQMRTFRHLLNNEFDDELFTFYGMTQLVKINARNGKSKPFGEPGLIRSIQPSPDGKYILLRLIDKPFSRKLPYWGFPFRYEMWDSKGKSLETLVQQPTRENLPLGGVQTGHRYIYWHPFYPHRMLMPETLDGGDPDMEVEYRDKLVYRDYPEPAQEYLRTVKRFQGTDFISRDQIIVYEYDWKKRWKTIYHLNLETGDKHVYYDFSVSEKYRDPGNLVMVNDEHGNSVVLLNDHSIYLDGMGYREDGTFPFVDKVNLDTWEKERIWQSSTDAYQRPTGFYRGFNEIVYRSESPSQAPNYFLYSFQDDTSRQLTDFDDPFREANQLEKRLVRYKRDDGIDLDGMLYLPPDYQPGKRYPMIMTAYPEEYTGEDVASQSVNRENRYTWLWGESPLYLCMQGYVVLDGAKIAIIGDPETVNETFIQQMTSSAEAAVSYLDSLGIIDPRRVAVMGHSYGAFMVVNLLAHSDKFACGIAKNGAYNRTLTPFGFQSERRTLWENRDLYLNVSPFLYADQINEPLLLIHSMEDTNSGTYPMQSERLFDAISQLGGICRYIQLPLEDHSYRARETHLHLLAEYLKFLEKYMGKS